MAVVGVVQKLNAQINHEFYSSNLYLQLSNWCAEQSMTGAASLLRTMAQGKVTHMMHVFDYMKQAGATPIVDQIVVARKRCNSLEELFHHTLADYCQRMDSLTRLSHAAREADDRSTLAFLDEMTLSQRQDGRRLRRLLAEIRKVSSDGLCLAKTDRHLSAMMHQLH